jgi:FAD/FMN-containing dehydrogenase
LTFTQVDRELVRLRERVLGDIVTPGDEAYEAARRVWNASIDRCPRLIVQCRTVDDVLAAVEFARSTDLLAAVRGGGHHIAGFSTCDDGIVIDLSPMKDISVDPRARRARAQGGVVWGELDRATQGFGLAVTGGLVSSTGIAGFTLGGGIGWLMRKHGLTCDSLAAAEVVTPEAEMVRASETENADLLWALRGGGGNFGIVTSFEYELHEVGPDLVGGYRFYPGDRAGDVVRLFRDLSREAPDELQLGLVLRLAPPYLPEAVQGKPVAAIGACYAGSIEDAWQALKPLDALGAPLADLLHVAPYTSLQTMLDAAWRPASRTTGGPSTCGSCPTPQWTSSSTPCSPSPRRSRTSRSGPLAGPSPACPRRPRPTATGRLRLSSTSTPDGRTARTPDAT